VNTGTTYLGLRLGHPYIAGASPFGHRLDALKRLEDAGCAAVVLHSIFEEQIVATRDGRIRGMDPTDPAFASSLAHFPPATDYPFEPDDYAEHVRAAKQALAIPVIASMNGTSAESWLKYARVIEEAGADALEINLYEVVTDLDVPAAAIETQLATIVRDLKSLLRIPIAVKLTPFFTAFGNVAQQLDRAGADGLVLFNRFYQPDIDVPTMTTTPDVELSSSAELRLRLRWTAILHDRVRASLAVTGGVETPDDGIKAVLAGADAVQLVSALLRHGPTHMEAMVRGLTRWMEWLRIDTLDAVRGRVSLRNTTDPSSFERGSYIRSLQSWGHAPQCTSTP
jgi:dihydroorotate dehydrogenase (fumarate)